MSDRRAAILKAAERLFEHYGHAKTTIADVAREAQVGVGTVYLEFASKEAIVEELSLSTHVGVLDAMRAASAKARDPESRFVAALLARTRCFLELRKKGQHACELLHCKAGGVMAAHERFLAEERRFFEGLLDEGRRAGTFGTFEPKLAAPLVQRAFASLTPPWITGSDEEAVLVASDLAALLLHGVLAGRERKRRRSTR